jgi:hypothetical protein
VLGVSGLFLVNAPQNFYLTVILLVAFIILFLVKRFPPINQSTKKFEKLNELIVKSMNIIFKLMLSLMFMDIITYTIICGLNLSIGLNYIYKNSFALFNFVFAIAFQLILIFTLIAAISPKNSRSLPTLNNPTYINTNEGNNLLAAVVSDSPAGDGTLKSAQTSNTPKLLNFKKHKIRKLSDQSIQTFQS